MIDLRLGDCREVLRALPDCSVDACVTDPPYELGFMGKKWDSSGIAYSQDVWREVLRVLKPGAHLIAFGGTRTYHRMTCAIEDSGFEIRDCLAWLYGSGFPKSLNLPGGFGSALKPAMEPAVLARKPLRGTVAANVQAFGTGALNVDGCRIAPSDGYLDNKVTQGGDHFSIGSGKSTRGTTFEPCAQGRWPANVIHDGSEEVLAGFPSSSAGAPRQDRGTGGIWSDGNGIPCGPQYGDTGSAARFFYTAKASTAEREVGLDHLPKHSAGELVGRKEGSAGIKSPRAGAGQGTATGRANIHPTVKPIDLMAYLVRLVTPPGGVVLDPFMGSGTTGMGAVLQDFGFIGIELDATHLEIAKGRINAAKRRDVYLTSDGAKVDPIDPRLQLLFAEEPAKDDLPW